MKKFISSVPIPMAGVSLGLTALGNLLQSYSENIRLLCGIIAFVLISLVIMKIVFCPNVVKEEFNNPIIASVSATIFMTLMQLSTYANPYLPRISFVVWVLAVLGHLVLIIYYTKKFLLRFVLSEVYPTCFITYVGIIVASITSVTYHLEAVGQIIFFLGFMGYVMTFILITHRYLKHDIPISAKPLFCIYAAPMSLSLVGYISVFTNKNLSFMFVMLLIGQLLYIVVLFQLPKFLKLPFFPSYAAFTFPFAITAFALKKVLGILLAMNYSSTALNILLNIETIIATVLIIYTVIHYCHHLFLNGKESLTTSSLSTLKKDTIS